jgi:hypothetical protein
MGREIESRKCAGWLIKYIYEEIVCIPNQTFTRLQDLWLPLIHKRFLNIFIILNPWHWKEWNRTHALWVIWQRHSRQDTKVEQNVFEKINWNVLALHTDMLLCIYVCIHTPLYVHRSIYIKSKVNMKYPGVVVYRYRLCLLCCGSWGRM